jgi:hypothetical protein
MKGLDNLNLKGLGSWEFEIKGKFGIKVMKIQLCLWISF